MYKFKKKLKIKHNNHDINKKTYMFPYDNLQQNSNNLYEFV